MATPTTSSACAAGSFKFKLIDAMEEVGLTEDEAEQYDRQIRLWGLEAQKRLRTSSVLVVGVRGLGAELCKNIVLAGVRSVTVLDSEPLGPEDAGGRFLGRTEGENRAQQAVRQLQALNPNVMVSADIGRAEEKDDDFFRQFTVVGSGVKFFCGDVWGFYGYFFSDLGHHDYAVEVPKVSEDAIAVDSPQVKQVSADQEEKTTVKKSCCFQSLEDALATDWASKPTRYFKRIPPSWFIVLTLQAFRDTRGSDPSLDSSGDREVLLQLKEEVAARHGVASDIIPQEFTRFCFSELSPVCAIVGGVLGQEVIKALSGKDEPYHNCFLYDGIQSTGIVESLR